MFKKRFVTTTTMRKREEEKKKKLRNINLFLKAEQSCFWDGNTDGK